MVKPFNIKSTARVGAPIIAGLLFSSANIVANPAVGSPYLSQPIVNEFKLMLEDDIDNIFLNEGEFGAPAVYKHKNGLQYSISVIFNNAYMEVSPETEIGVMSTEPFCFCKTKAFRHELGPGDVVYVEGHKYLIERGEPDGTGITAIFLTKVRNVN